MGRCLWPEMVQPAPRPPPGPEEKNRPGRRRHRLSSSPRRQCVFSVQ